MDFKTRLKSCRMEKKFTQDEMGACIGISGAGYSYYEKGTRTPNPTQIQKLAAKLGVSADYLVCAVDSPNEVFTSNVTISDVDPQIEEIVEICKLLTAQGLEHVRFTAQLLSENPRFKREHPEKMPPMSLKRD